MPDSAPLPAAPAAVELLDPAAVLAAASDPARFAVLKLLADGTSLSVGELAAKLGRTQDNLSKHLRALRDARLVRVIPAPDGDGRKTHHDIHPMFRTRDAAGKTILDFGTVLFRVD